METSILKSTKKSLGLDATYTPFDQDILVCINSALGTLTQIGVLPNAGFSVVDATDTWSELNLSLPMLGMVKSYIYVKVRVLFDPPTTSFLLSAYQKQTEEFEWRLKMLKEYETSLL
jgi:hypothetical protein